MSENRDQKFSVRLFTSSHGLASHHFPKALARVFKENSLIEYPVVDAVGGRVMHEDFVAYYKQEFEKIKQTRKPTISILLLGDNNIRRYAVVGAFRVYQHTKEITELHKGTCHPLLVCGLVPSPKTIPQSGILCEHVDDVLQKMINDLHCDPAGRLFGYVCTTSFFVDEQGFVIEKKHFAKDGIHLNELGAHVLALHLLANAKMLADSVLKYQV